MKKIILAILASAFFISTSTRAALLLEVDLSVTDTVTITATSGLSSATISGSDFIGFYLDNFFAANTNSISDTLISGNLTSAQNTSDGTPDLFRFSGDTGLNVFSYTNDATSDFLAGSLAFSGLATWTISSGAYADALAGAGSGTLFFPADDIGDVNGATAIGTWQVVGSSSSVPAPAPLVLTAIGLLSLGYSRKKAV